MCRTNLIYTCTTQIHVGECVARETNPVLAMVVNLVLIERAKA